MWYTHLSGCQLVLASSNTVPLACRSARLASRRQTCPTSSPAGLMVNQHMPATLASCSTKVGPSRACKLQEPACHLATATQTLVVRPHHLHIANTGHNTACLSVITRCLWPTVTNRMHCYQQGIIMHTRHIGQDGNFAPRSAAVGHYGDYEQQK